MDFLAVSTLLLARGAAQADILPLKDGSRYYGKLIQRGEFSPLLEDNAS